MIDQNLQKQTEEKQKELAKLVEKYGLTSEKVIALEEELDQLVILHLKRFMETQHKHYQHA